eukprot:scaffold9980_cov121-Isochrysis_galbana.AAC.2
MHCRELVVKYGELPVLLLDLVLHLAEERRRVQRLCDDAGHAVSRLSARIGGPSIFGAPCDRRRSAGRPSTASGVVRCASSSSP